MSRPSSRNAARPKTPVGTRSFERPEAKQTISKHLGTVLEDGLDVFIEKVCVDILDRRVEPRRSVMEEIFDLVWTREKRAGVSLSSWSIEVAVSGRGLRQLEIEPPWHVG